MPGSTYLSWVGTDRARAWAPYVALAGAAAYVAAIAVEAASSQGSSWSVLGRAVHDLLLLAAALAIGGSGFLWRVWRARRDRLVDETGELLCALTADLRTLGRHLAAAVWDLGKPLHTVEGRLDNISSTSAADLVGHEQGQLQLLQVFTQTYELLTLQQALLERASTAGGVSPIPASIAVTAANARSHVDALAMLADTLHGRALELAEYDPPLVGHLLAATSKMRTGIDEFSFETSFGPSTPHAQARQATGLFVTVMGGLVEVFAAIRQVEAVTAGILDGTDSGAQIAQDLRERWQHEEQLTRTSVEVARISADAQQNLDDARAALADLREQLGLDRKVEAPGET